MNTEKVSTWIGILISIVLTLVIGTSIWGGIAKIYSSIDYCKDKGYDGITSSRTRKLLSFENRLNYNFYCYKEINKDVGIEYEYSGLVKINSIPINYRWYED